MTHLSMGMVIGVNMIVIFFVLEILLVTEFTVKHIFEMFQTVFNCFLFFLFILKKNKKSINKADCLIYRV